MPLPEYNGALGTKRAAHLLRRATFGANPTQIKNFAAMTPAQAIDALFPSSELPMPLPPIDPQTGQEWVTAGPTGANSEEFKLGQYYMGWLLAQMMAYQIPDNQALAYSTREKIVFFLHTHFTCVANKVQSSRALYFQNQLFRQYAFDNLPSTFEKNFKTLTAKVSVDNAMIKLLDGRLNVKGNPNENYGRELLELYSIGRGLEGKVTPGPDAGDYGVYTEQDVQTAARVLSGWDEDDEFGTLDPDTLLPRGKVKGTPTNASAHDMEDAATPKQFSARLGNMVVTPDPAKLNGGDATEDSMLDELRQLVDVIYDQPDNRTARNICWKLYRFFVYAPHDVYAPGNLVESIDSQIIDVLASDFRNNGYKLQPVLENLLRSQHFYEFAAGYADDNFGGIIKSPIDLVIGTLKTFGYQLPDVSVDAEAFYMATTQLLYEFQMMGLHFYEPFDVAGYEGYHQFPLYHRAWITPTSLANRYAFIRSVFTSNNDGLFQVDPLTFVTDHLSDVAPDAQELAKAVAEFLLPVSQSLSMNAPDPNAEITFERMNYFVNAFLGTFPASYWTENWNDYTDLEELRGFLRQLFNAMLQSPEYQLQ
jgi:uncharacterized protein (DUF1800 family)